MSAKKEDPRAVRSKCILKESLIALLVESQDIQQLTVKKVTEKAELNRATFYLHYLDMHDLLKQVVYDIFDDLSDQLSLILSLEKMAVDEQLLIFLDYFYQHRKYLSVLFEEQGFQKKLHNFIIELVQVRRGMQKMTTKDVIISEDIIAASILGILMWWIRDGKHHSSEYIAEQLSVLMTKR